jgi:hypothetical protein
MTLVKVDQDIVQVISRDQSCFTVLTREREVKKISANQINAISALDIKRTLNDIKSNNVVYLPEYRKVKNYCCS